MKNDQGMENLKKALKDDLSFIEYPPMAWKLPKESRICDVVIVGAGMAGLAAAAALKLVGIPNVRLYDAMPYSFEGPWMTYARMRHLRSGKDLMGPALNIPHLTFRAWYTAQKGEEAWIKLYKIPNDLWMDYLNWYREVLHLHVINEHDLKTISSSDSHLKLTFKNHDKEVDVLCNKIVLATGRAGFGGLKYPDFIHTIPKEFYAHTAEAINFKGLKGKRIGIVGAGASAFDAAATALEQKCGQVDLMIRREQLPSVNKLASLTYPGFSFGYYYLADRQKWQFFKEYEAVGAPPPIESLERVRDYSNFHLKTQLLIQSANLHNHEVVLKTNQGDFRYDFLILATGFNIQGNLVQELEPFFNDITLWKDILPVSKKYGEFPYLGPHFQLMDKSGGKSSFLKNVYCFNYAATLSHGLISSDIPGISIGAMRLAQGIAADFFTENSEGYLQLLKNYKVEEF